MDTVEGQPLLRADVGGEDFGADVLQARARLAELQEVAVEEVPRAALVRRREDRHLLRVHDFRARGPTGRHLVEFGFRLLVVEHPDPRLDLRLREDLVPAQDGSRGPHAVWVRGQRCLLFCS